MITQDSTRQDTLRCPIEPCSTPTYVVRKRSRVRVRIRVRIRVKVRIGVKVRVRLELRSGLVLGLAPPKP